MKIAPQTKALLRVSGIRTMGGGQIGTKALHAELRALLSVARAAERGLYDPFGYGLLPLERALSRLEKVSKP